MSTNTAVHLSRKSNWPHIKPMPGVRIDGAGEPGVLKNIVAETDVNASSPASGTLFESQSSTVVFIVDRESALNGEPDLKAFCTPGSLLSPFPASWEDLVTRVRAAIRHSNGFTNVVSFGDVRVNFASMEVTRTGERMPLTAQEFKTLKFFMMNPSRVISRDELLNEAWGYDSYPCTRTVDNHVLRLRQKLESDPSDPVHFLTMHGAGYRFVP